MAYRGSNYSFVIDSSFQPYSFQEMLQPYLLYKQEYEKQEAAADELARGANKFKYLSETLPEGSRSKEIYENYANELSKQAEDLARNGLSINNRQGIVGLKRRYEGEIGLLDRASQKLQKELELRRQLGAKDPSMLYADDNLNIDKYLGDSTPNLYNISGSELYARGAQAGKSASSRLYSAGDEGSTLNGYYRRWVERYGYSKDSIDAFRANASAIPELQQAADAILEERGVNENLTGANLERARQSVLNGIIDGAVYKEEVKPVRDEGVLSASAAKQYALQEEARNFEREINGWRKDANGQWYHDPNLDLKTQAAVGAAKAVAEAKNSGKGSTGKTSGTGRSGAGANKLTQSAERLKIRWKGNNPNPTNGEADDDYEIETVDKTETSHPGKLVNYENLPPYAQKLADEIIGDGDADLYQFYFNPYKSGWFGDSEAELEIVPRDIKDFKQPETLDNSVFGIQ